MLDHINIAKDVILAEANALFKLSKSLNDDFNKAIELILSCSQKHNNCRVIISGIGKSGHVSRKISSTFSSTGQPSFFLHPAEASHGDLGMITENDVLILLSYSGEAVELQSIINYAHRHLIPIIAITGRRESTLSRVSSVSLILPQEPEACPMGLAPTTSSTMMIALGDALAIALLTNKGFSKNDFKTFHPGGSLGQQLKRVHDIMHVKPNIPLISDSSEMSEVIIKITSYGFGCMGITNHKEELLGIITDGDLRRHMNSNLLKQKAIDVMTTPPLTISSDALLVDALNIFESKSIASLFITENDRPVGIIRLLDCLHYKAF